jgi:hypothetical protein
MHCVLNTAVYNTWQPCLKHLTHSVYPGPELKCLTGLHTAADMKTLALHQRHHYHQHQTLDGPSLIC